MLPSRERPFDGKQDSTSSARPPVRPVQPLLFALFRRFIAKRRLRKQFRAVRLAFAHRLPASNSSAKLIFYLNHPSWWDPLLSMVLAQRFIPGRHFYAPIEAESLERYKLFRRFGLFPVEVGTPRGAVQFLRAAELVLQRGNVLGLTPQGTFTDARMRPPALKPGLGTLLARLEHSGSNVTVVPVALEYTFWNQRLPEALAAVGTPIYTSPQTTARTAQEWTAELETCLTATQDELAQLSQTRDEGAFEVILEGRRGTSGLYGFWRKLGQKGDPDHVAKTGQQAP